VRARIVAVVGAIAVSVAIGGGQAAARANDTAASLKTAIAAEKQALKDLDKGKLGDVKSKLDESRGALESAKGGLKGSKFDLARADVKQALTDDGVALENLGTAVRREFARSRINYGIIHKEAALDVYERATAVNHPPKITEFSASFVAPLTTYQVLATDPDPGDTGRLKFTWAKKQLKPCGVFTPRGQIATWSHPDASFKPPGDCPDEPVHPATITVSVSDGKGESCTVTYPHGSAPTPGFDPGETCKNVGLPGLAPADARVLSAVLDRAILREERSASRIQNSITGRDEAAFDLGQTALTLERVENSLAAHAGTGAIQRQVHEAAALDREAAVDGSDGEVDPALNKLDAADAKKKAARKKLDAIGEQ
jgi:hypothetical protein